MGPTWWHLSVATYVYRVRGWVCAGLGDGLVLAAAVLDGVWYDAVRSVGGAQHG